MNNILHRIDSLYWPIITEYSHRGYFLNMTQFLLHVIWLAKTKSDASLLRGGFVTAVVETRYHFVYWAPSDDLFEQ